jgi:GNAT superfamily N-acetyltransferase
MNILITRQRPDTADASALIAELDAQLAAVYPAQSRHGFSVQKLIDQRVDFFVMRCDETPAACGGIMSVANEYAEIKRMYVRPAFRRRGCGRRMLQHLADHARARSLPLLRLETGVHQREALRLYETAGFRPIPPFGAYRDDPLSRCYELRLDACHCHAGKHLALSEPV